MKKAKNIIKNIWEKQFWPVNLMKDCSKGNAIERYMAYQYNQTKAYLLQAPILNWIIFALASFYGLVLAEMIGKKVSPLANLVAAFCGVSFAMSVIPPLILSISYIFLKNVNIKIEKN